MLNPSFEQKKHVVLNNVISKENCALLADYARFQAQLHPNVRKKGDPLAHVHRAYGDPLMEVLLEQLTPLVEKATGLTLWPTLSFYYTYTHGNQLAPHKDRSSCEIVVGLCIGADEAFNLSGDCWPLVLDLEGKPQPIALKAGDAVIFKGHETTHWREVFTGVWFVSAIFAYVDKQGAYAFQKYDQRKYLGAKHVGMFRWTWGCAKQRMKHFFGRITSRQR